MRSLLLVLLVTPLILAPSAPQDTKPQESIEDLIRLLRSDDATVRDRATEQMLARWNEWRDADLGKLGEAKKQRDPEVASRAKETLERIQVRRQVGASLLRHVEGIEAVFLEGGAADCLRVLDEAGALWNDKKLEDSDLERLAELVTHHPRAPAPKALLRAAKVKPYGRLVKPFLKSKDARMRAVAAATLARIGAATYVNEILAVRNHGDRTARRKVDNALKDLGQRVQVEVILPFLEAKDQGVRGWAARSLALRVTRKHVEKMVPLLNDESAEIRCSVVVALWRGGKGEFTPQIFSLLKDESDEVRRTTARVIWHMRPGAYVDRLLPLLKDEDPDVRGMAVIALGRMGSAENAEDLLPLLTDPIAKVRYWAARALTRVGGPECAERLLPLLKHENPDIRRTALDTIAKMGGREHAESILPFLADPSERVRERTVEALRMMRAREHADKILPLLNDESRWVRYSARRVKITICVILAQKWRFRLRFSG